MIYGVSLMSSLEKRYLECTVYKEVSVELFTLLVASWQYLSTVFLVWGMLADDWLNILALYIEWGMVTLGAIFWTPELVPYHLAKSL